MLEDVVRRDPTSALAHAGVAYGYANIGHAPPFPAWSHLKAKAAADLALQLDPEHPTGWMALGLTYSELGQFDEAIDAHERLEGTVWSWVIGG